MDRRTESGVFHGGFLMGGFAIGVIIGIPGAGWIYDSTGSYELVLIACLAGLSMATLLTSLIRPKRHHPEFVTLNPPLEGPRP